MLAASRRNNHPVTMLPEVKQQDDDQTTTAAAAAAGFETLEAKTKATSRLHPLKLFYSKSKSSTSSSSQPQSLAQEVSSAKKNGAKSDNKNKKKSKKQQQSANPSGNINESINFSSASSSGYNSHINPAGESSRVQHQQPQYFSQQFYQRPFVAPKQQFEHQPSSQIDTSLPATFDDTFIYVRQADSYQGGEDESRPQQHQQQHHWRRSVSLRAPMVPMMIDDEIELIDDMDEVNHNNNNNMSYGLNQQQQQQQYQFQHHHYQNRPYQQHQQQFLLSDESGDASQQCVDSLAAAPPSESYHLQPSNSYHHHHHHSHQSSEPQLHHRRMSHDDVDAHEDEADDDDDDGDGVAQYSQVRHPQGGTNQDNYADRITVLQQKQQHQMRLATVLRQRQQQQQQQHFEEATTTTTTDQQRAGQLSSKPTFSPDGPLIQQHQHQFPVAIYHQPNLNNQHPHQYYATTFSHQQQQQQQVRDLQRRYQPTPFSQTTQTPVSPPPTLSSAANQQHQHHHPQSLSRRPANSRKSIGSSPRGKRKQQPPGGSSRGSSTGASSQTDSGQSSEPTSGSASIGATVNHLINGIGILDTSSKKMQSVSSSGATSGNQQYRNLQHHQAHSSSNRLKSAATTSNQGSGGSGRQRTPKSLHSSANKNGGAADDGGGPTLGFCGKFAKLLLFVSNILFWSAGIALGAWGILSLVDDHKYNLSQLLVFEPSTKMSLFQLLSWSFITLGCATILVGFCGCSAIFKNNRWILGLYIFLILAIFALDLATGLLAIIFQERLVANVRLRLANKLRSDYGVQASFTAAIDYIQTRYECCGLEGHFDYDQSLWRLQRLGGFEATVARTCCHLRNTFDDQAHVNPRPVNESMCQSNDVRFHQSYRYRKGCLDDLERLVRHKIWTFTIGCGAVGGVILLSLLFATCFCRSIPTGSSGNSRKSSSQQQDNNNNSNKKQSGFIQTTNAQQQLQRQHHR